MDAVRQVKNVGKDQKSALELRNLHLNETKNKSRKNINKQNLIIIIFIKNLKTRKSGLKSKKRYGNRYGHFSYYIIGHSVTDYNVIKSSEIPIARPCVGQ